MPETNEALHDRFLALSDPPSEGSIVDLGCGAGPALAAFARRHPKAQLIGFDREVESLAKARDRLRGHSGPVKLESADLREKFPLDAASVDAVVSSNLLECLPDPTLFLREVHRVLRPGGRMVLSHSDFDSLVVSGAPVELDRKVLHAFADDSPPWMDSSDGRMGRKLPGLVAASPLVRTHVETLVTHSAELSGHAARRVGDIRGALRSTARRGCGRVDTVEVEDWYAAVQQADAEGRFFFAEMAVVVAAHRV
ncbi:methyltransferase domain-containing protein [Streptomyces sp. bgisy027]|uniref:methyltransferase domain-containing protein n=1 Tax=Streptomyces sp. bgisy027 TaxID=3413770 RepID=UPI003D74A81F